MTECYAKPHVAFPLSASCPLWGDQPIPPHVPSKFIVSSNHVPNPWKQWTQLHLPSLKPFSWRFWLQSHGNSDNRSKVFWNRALCFPRAKASVFTISQASVQGKGRCLANCSMHGKRQLRKESGQCAGSPPAHPSFPCLLMSLDPKLTLLVPEALVLHNSQKN